MQQETHIENIRALHSALVTKRATLDQLIWQANRAGISDDNRFRHDKQYFLSLPEREHSDRYRFALLAVVPQAYDTGTAGYDAA
jgi:hypothetical protein